MDANNNIRESNNFVDPLFISRWSPRSFLDKKVSNESLLSLFEAARWSPSSFNEQPWFFLYATKEKDIKRFSDLLLDINKVWASKAPMLLFILARKHFERNARNNYHSEFDTGAAWMSLALQASKLGLHCHAIAGIHKDKAYKELSVPTHKYNIMCAVALGYLGNRESLPKEYQDKEKLSHRKDLSLIYKEASF